MTLYCTYYKILGKWIVSESVMCNNNNFVIAYTTVIMFTTRGDYHAILSFS